MRFHLAAFCVALSCALGACESPTIVPPPPLFAETDWSVPEPTQTGCSVRLVSNRTNNVVYDGEALVVKVALFGAERGLFAALLDFRCDPNIVLERISANPAYISATRDHTVQFSYLGPGTAAASYGVVYKQGTVANTADRGVLVNLTCRAQGTGTGRVWIASQYFRRADGTLTPATTGVNVAVAWDTLRIDVRDEFRGN